MEGEETPRAVRARILRKMETFASFVSPTVAAIYFILSALFSLRATTFVLGLLAISSSIVGTFLLLQKKRHPEGIYDGQIVITENENGGKMFSIEVNGEPLDMEFKDEVLFKIRRISDPQE